MLMHYDTAIIGEGEEVVTYHMKNGSQHAINVPVKSFQQIKEISKSLQLRQASKPATRYV